MSCPRCSAAIRPTRRYCGQCGCNLAPACGGCGFANEHDDRFCGGCGLGLTARGVEAFAPAPAVAHVPAGVASAPASPWSTEELAGLFAVHAVTDDGPQLPESGVGQDDLDRLFGGAP